MIIVATRENFKEVLDKYGDKRGMIKGVYIYDGKRVEGQPIQVQTPYKNYIDGAFKNLSNHGHVESFTFEFNEEDN